MPVSPDLAIFVVTTPTTDDTQTKPIALPLVHVRGVITIDWEIFISLLLVRATEIKNVNYSFVHANVYGKGR